jgi:hypothetical protein
MKMNLILLVTDIDGVATRSADSAYIDCDVEDMPHHARKLMAEVIVGGFQRGRDMREICIPFESGEPITEIKATDPTMDEAVAEERQMERERAQEANAVFRRG